MPKFAANLTMMFTEVAFPQRFAAAAAAGFSAVEFLSPYDYPPAQVATWLQENHLECVLFNLPTGDWAAGERGLAALPGREDECRAGVARAIEYALATGTTRLHMMAGLMPAGADAAAYRATFLANLRDAAHAVGRHGLTLLIEPINPRDIPGYFLNTQAQAHALREESGAANVKVQMDFYHAQIVEGDLATTFKKHIADIGHVQIASVPGRNEPDDGEINYPYLFRLLDELGYEGWIGCEYRPRGRTEDGLGWLAKAGLG
ncbi:hydroxypyruvate isomerase family protein [Actimicrobium sp. CCC2.4]|uniref:2-oxo-tetronate isomerase n=1 Tax=Actimicrobium sp. CCC2.4 TaxID=3048606 RepID=UPI002AC9211C|nr:2-oxo-tetronate isomerase [Actimicrobium sp. CCC2.4]MEB0133954.1 hydroxypyruvate isomerase family protein [Actimicrobium sp. CCC2.4]WPX31493.1 hydroxypyruvate isomerase family protein [Actimicrobium sp. CCC2.4]